MNPPPVASSPAAASNKHKNNNMSPIAHSPAHHRRDTSSESGTKRIPSEQWEAKRMIITQLYQEEKRSLKEVMDILERDYGFTATVKMFKSRIWKWGLDKKLKSDEVLAIMVLKHERDAQGKQSEFMIRNQPVDMDNINRYIKRNPQLVARFRAGERPSTQTSMEVQCRTPRLDTGGGNAAAAAAAAAITTTSLPRVMTRGAMAGQTMQSQGKDVLVLLREYIEDSLYSGRWRWEHNDSCTTYAANDRSDELFERTLTSLALINRCMARETTTSPLGGAPRFASPGEMLDPAFAALQELVAVQSPVFATRMLSLLWFLDTHHKSGLPQLIVKQLASLVVETLGSQHLMAQIWRVLAADDEEQGYSPCDYRGLCETAYTTLVPLLERRLGPANKITTMMYGDHVDFLFHGGRLDEAMGLCVEYQARAEGTGRQHAWIKELEGIRIAIGDAREDINGTIAAMEMEMANDAMRMHDEEHQATMLLRQGNLGMQTGQVDVAMSQFAQAAQMLAGGISGGGGAGDVRLLLAALANLEAAQERMGEAAAAEGTRGERMRVQDGFVMETRGLAEEMRRARGSVGSESMASSSGGGGMDGEERRRLSTGAPWGMRPAGAAGAAGMEGGEEAGWGWSPEVFVSPAAGMNDWSLTM